MKNKLTIIAILTLAIWMFNTAVAQGDPCEDKKSNCKIYKKFKDIEKTCRKWQEEQCDAKEELEKKLTEKIDKIKKKGGRRSSSSQSRAAPPRTSAFQTQQAPPRRSSIAPTQQTISPGPNAGRRSPVREQPSSPSPRRSPIVY